MMVFMSGLLVDRRLNLTLKPAFLRSIDPSEHVWWRPLETFALVVVSVAICSTLSALVASLVNYWLIHGLMLHEWPTWPGSAILAVRANQMHCGDCLLGGITAGVMLGVMSAAGLGGLLWAVSVVNHRRLGTWITAAPRFRWRLFFFGLGSFSLLLGGAAAIPEALHGWPDRPTFLREGEFLSVRLVYMLVMLTALPVAAAFEEVLCRGWLLQTTAAFTPSLPAILLLNSLVFALLHTDSDLGHNVSRILFAAALSYAALRLGGVELGIGVHAANNLVILLLAQTIPQAEKSSPATLGGVLVNLLVASLVVGLAELVSRWEPLRRWTHAEDGAWDFVAPAPPGLGAMG
jgi:membrane protease YdiL (CAAX protease family)